MTLLLRKVDRLAEWRMAPAGWGPRAGIPSACLRDLDDSHSSPSVYELTSDEQMLDVAAVLASNREKLQTLHCIVFDDAGIKERDIEVRKTEAAIASEIAQTAHFELAQLTVEDTVFIAGVVHNAAQTGKTASHTQPGIRIFFVAELRARIRELLTDKRLEENHIKADVLKKVRET